MGLSPHCVDRVRDRLVSVGVNPDDMERLLDRVSRSVPPGSSAVRLFSLGKHVGPSGPDHYSRSSSNGDEVWCVVRDGDVRTVMFRRSDQPRRPDAFGVDRVLRLN